MQWRQYVVRREGVSYSYELADREASLRPRAIFWVQTYAVARAISHKKINWRTFLEGYGSIAHQGTGHTSSLLLLLNLNMAILDDVLREAGFSDKAIAEVKDGKLHYGGSLDAASDKELSVKLASLSCQSKVGKCKRYFYWWS